MAPGCGRMLGPVWAPEASMIKTNEHISSIEVIFSKLGDLNHGVKSP